MELNVVFIHRSYSSFVWSEKPHAKHESTLVMHVSVVTSCIASFSVIRLLHRSKCGCCLDRINMSRLKCIGPVASEMRSITATDLFPALPVKNYASFSSDCMVMTWLQIHAWVDYYSCDRIICTWVVSNPSSVQTLGMQPFLHHSGKTLRVTDTRCTSFRRLKYWILTHYSIPVHRFQDILIPIRFWYKYRFHLTIANQHNSILLQPHHFQRIRHPASTAYHQCITRNQQQVSVIKSNTSQSIANQSR